MQKRKRNYKLDYRNYNPFVYSILCYSPLILPFVLKHLKKRLTIFSLKLLSNDHGSDYQLLLEKTKTLTMEIKRLRSLALKTFKILDYQNQFVMKEIFHVSSHNYYYYHFIYS